MSDAHALGIYKAVVVDNNDPLKSFRVVCKIPQVLGDALSNWCVPVVPTIFKPRIGEVVWVQFANGDTSAPMYQSRVHVTREMADPDLQGDGVPRPTLFANTPSDGSISWTSFNLQYLGIAYHIPAGFTDQKYTYWTFNNAQGGPLQYTDDANVVAALRDDDMLLFINRNGIPANAQLADMVSGDFIVPGSILAGNIGAGQVSAEHLDVYSVTDDKLAPTIILPGEIKLGDYIDLAKADGIVVRNPDSSISAQLAANGSGNFLHGAGSFDSADFAGSVKINGDTNWLNGTITANSGKVTDPSTVPQVTSSYDMVDVGGAGVYRKGLTAFHDPTANPGKWVTTDTVGNSSSVQAWGKDGGPGLYTFDVQSGWIAMGGVVQVGGYYHVLCRSTSNSSNWRILVYRGSDQGYVGSYYTSPNIPESISTTSLPSIGKDTSGNILIVFAQNGNFFIRKIGAAGTVNAGKQIGATLNCGPWNSTVDFWGVQQVGSYYFASYYGGIRAHDINVGARNQAQEFPVATGMLSGAEFDGTVWNTFSHGQYFYKYTNNTGTWDFAYTWYDNDTGVLAGNAGGAATAETRKSQIKTVAPTKFAKWTVALPFKPPDDGTVDGANTARIYAAPTGQPLTLQTTLPEGQLSQDFAALTTTGAAYIDSSGFDVRVAANPGRFKSAIMDAQGNPIWDLKGSGPGQVGGVKWNASGLDTSGTKRNKGMFASTAGQTATAAEFNAGTLSVTLRQGRRYLVRWTGPLFGGTAGQYVEIKLKYGVGATTGGTVFGGGYADIRQASRIFTSVIEGELTWSSADTALNVVATLTGVGGTAGLSTNYATTLIIEEMDN